MADDSQSNALPDIIARLGSALMISTDAAQLYKAIVDTPFTDKLLATSIDLGIVVLLLVNPKTQTIDRVALSDTEHATGAVKVSAKPFHDIRIPVNVANNSIAQAIETGTFQITEDWMTLFTPELTADEARRNQSGASIESSLVWPLSVKDGGALIFSFYQPRSYITDEHLKFAQDYADIVSQRLTALKSE